jgi:hypothetical protein
MRHIQITRNAPPRQHFTIIKYLNESDRVVIAAERCERNVEHRVHERILEVVRKQVAQKARLRHQSTND